MLNESCCINFGTIAEIMFKMTLELKFDDKVRTCFGVSTSLMTKIFVLAPSEPPDDVISGNTFGSTCYHKQEKTCSFYCYKCWRSRLRFSAKFRNDDVDFRSTFTWKSVWVCLRKETLRSRNNSFVFTLIESIEFKAPYVPSIILFKLKENHDKYFFFVPREASPARRHVDVRNENTGECGKAGGKRKNIKWKLCRTLGRVQSPSACLIAQKTHWKIIYSCKRKITINSITTKHCWSSLPSKLPS